MLTIRSDENRPKCGLCKKDDFVCDGYTDMQIIQSHSRGLPRSKERGTSQIGQSLDRVLLPTDTVHLAEEALFSRLYSDLFATHSGLWVGFAAARKSSGVARQCLVALSQSYHEQHENNSVTKSGMAIFLKSLQDVNKNLNDLESRKSTDTLLSVAILGVYGVRSQILLKVLLVLTLIDAFFNDTIILDSPPVWPCSFVESYRSSGLLGQDQL